MSPLGLVMLHAALYSAGIEGGPKKVGDNKAARHVFGWQTHELWQKLTSKKLCSSAGGNSDDRVSRHPSDLRNTLACVAADPFFRVRATSRGPEWDAD